MWKAILIDDEEIGLDVLDIMLSETGQVEVVGKYQLVHEAMTACRDKQPELIFLDIEMPGISGLDAAEQLNVICPDAAIIFVTAHDQYAIDAFHTEAIGYLLKPVAPAKLERTLGRYATQRNKQYQQTTGSVDSMDNDEHNNMELEQPASPAPSIATLSLRVMGSLQVNAVDGRLLSWRTRKTKELFALLWHYQGNPVYKFTILEQLWADVPAQQGQKLLHTSLYYVRNLFKTLGYDDVVKYGDERYWIEPAIFHSDLAQLLELIAQQTVTAETVSQVIALYSGDYLETEHYTWADAYRIELRGSVAAYLVQALSQLAVDEQIAPLYKLLELEPDVDRHYEQLMQLLLDTNDATGAARVKERQQQLWAENRER
ncbi:response regulator [Paenibacillus hunanensis]|uniref:Two-component SAPR family response regulator n=1 Tax=Paenibacillus hunanensis TaxID=539262 RepID=A0ABU1J2T5_9BACL|nr:response regulator [Paenibacillus hunanensis]MDR6245820.1 two-component SAPR family response regulator [Paenibacillus hunanensis]GGJ16547.1 DNA-binding response regulator [Paenibacillus hunanensis]